jgi:hypothetical protein
MKRVYYVLISIVTTVLSIPMIFVILAFEDAMVRAHQIRKYFDND